MTLTPPQTPKQAAMAIYQLSRVFNHAMSLDCLSDGDLQDLTLAVLQCTSQVQTAIDDATANRKHAPIVLTREQLFAVDSTVTR